MVMELNDINVRRSVGAKMLALERNVAEYRALQMVLVLFYVEDLQNLIDGCINLPKDTKRRSEKSLKQLVDDNVLSEIERTEIKSLRDCSSD